jgi:hypothetical protein
MYSFAIFRAIKAGYLTSGLSSVSRELGNTDQETQERLGDKLRFVFRNYAL